MIESRPLAESAQVKNEEVTTADVVLDMDENNTNAHDENTDENLSSTNNNDTNQTIQVSHSISNTEVTDIDDSCHEGDDTFNPNTSLYPVTPNTNNTFKRSLSPKRLQLSSRSSDSIGSSLSNHTHDTLDTFNSFSSSLSPRAESPKYSIGTPESSNSLLTPKSRGSGAIMREDSFDRKKTTYKSTYKAVPKMERAKILGVNEYTFLRTLGKGAFAEVKLATKSKLENDDVVRVLDVDDFERYAIKIIKKNFMQDKRKFQSNASTRNITPPTGTVTFKSTVTVDEGEKTAGGKGVGGGAEAGGTGQEEKKSLVSTPPARATGRSMRMKNKKFQTPASTAATTAANTAANTNVSAPTTAESSTSPVPLSIQSNGIASTTTASIGSDGSGLSTPQSRKKADLSVCTDIDSTTATTPPLPQSLSSSPKHPEPPPVANEVLQEIEILKFLRHKNLVKLCEIIDDPSSKHLYIVMEYVPAGPIMVRESANGSFISRLTGGVLLESMASRIFKDLMSVLEYLHLNHIAHRDLKPDNLLVDYRGNLKVSDFGVSNHFSEEKRKKAVNMRQLSRSKSRGVVNSTEGTFAFYSPEMCRENAGAYSAYMSDVWAASVCLWIFIFGELPLYTPDIVDLFAMIRSETPVLPHRVSPELTHLFDKILQKDQDHRLSIHDIQNHCWLKRCPLKGNGISSDDFETDDDLETSVDDLKNKLSPRVYASVIRWAQIAREKCILRTEKYLQDMDSELVNMLRRSSIAFKVEDIDDFGDSDNGNSSDDDDPLARLVSYDDISGVVMEEIKKHDERQAALKKMATLVEGNEGKSPSQATPPKPKKALRTGRRSKINLNDDYLKSSSTSLASDNSIASTPTLEIHERLTQEAIMALELETFTLNTNKQLKQAGDTKDIKKQQPGGEGEIASCCSVS